MHMYRYRTLQRIHDMYFWKYILSVYVVSDTLVYGFFDYDTSVVGLMSVWVSKYSPGSWIEQATELTKFWIYTEFCAALTQLFVTFLLFFLLFYSFVQ
jgi:hypothetical protein